MAEEHHTRRRKGGICGHEWERRETDFKAIAWKSAKKSECMREKLWGQDFVPLAGLSTSRLILSKAESPRRTAQPTWQKQETGLFRNFRATFKK